MPNLISTDMWDHVVTSLDTIKRHQNNFEAIIEPLRLEYDSPLTESFYHIQDLAIKTLSKLIGDDGDWLLWFVYDNDFGSRKFEVVINNGKERIVCEGYMDLKKIIECSYNCYEEDYE